ncbi:MAG: glutamate mutase L [Acholeplasmatales bacterium]|jgi:uncharacterized protein (TIGR01319 family)|nr:glutamate mutase L [Acholeplasmataceae bacterium]MCK9289391.1 glutamate mutase L [Acholeplasmataceae bacterium]MCK9428103.1 glutamate mutase L [Acholeplasmataceae bacterium]MDY0115025.1 glutamate mutase L [Acholeplasmatales bacterium]HHT39978.1 DNA mismatch repair protein MutL [Acholeplasmataceae bacterium]
MKVDLLVAEIGSTTTLISAFNLKKEVVFLGRSYAKTTIDDVMMGLNEAIANLKKHLKTTTLEYQEMLASSSAAGGLRMTVHGLVYEMTAKAAKEAALNAGANLDLVTAGLLSASDIEKIKSLKPNIIVIAGGTNYGEKETAYQNLLKVLPLKIPIIYAGNISNHDKIKDLNNPFIEIVDNVYPRLDDFNIIPLRKAIYRVFSRNIIHAKGMEKVAKIIKGKIIPTPGAVMDATLLADELINGVVTIDVGGATTDIHSVVSPQEEYAIYSEGEPRFKRTVEGDLGVFLNREKVVSKFKENQLEELVQLNKNEIREIIIKEPFIPKTIKGAEIISALTKKCLELACDRHVGDLKRIYTSNGIKIIPEGKDLSLVKLIALTGGALINNEDAITMVKNYLNKSKTKLVPQGKVKILKDHDYLFSSIGVISHYYPEEAQVLLKKTLRWED